MFLYLHQIKHAQCVGTHRARLGSLPHFLSLSLCPLSPSRFHTKGDENWIYREQSHLLLLQRWQFWLFWFIYGIYVYV